MFWERAVEHFSCHHPQVMRPNTSQERAEERSGCPRAGSDSNGEVSESSGTVSPASKAKPENAASLHAPIDSASIPLGCSQSSPRPGYQRPGPEAFRAALAMLNAPILLDAVPTATAQKPRRKNDAAVPAAAKDAARNAGAQHRQRPLVDLAAQACQTGDHGAGIYQTFQKQQVSLFPPCTNQHIFSRSALQMTYQGFLLWRCRYWTSLE